MKSSSTSMAVFEVDELAARASSSPAGARRSTEAIRMRGGRSHLDSLAESEPEIRIRTRSRELSSLRERDRREASGGESKK